VPRTTSGVSRSGGMPPIRKEVSSWSGEVLGSTLHTGHGTTDLFSRTSPREPFEGWGSRRFLVAAPGFDTTRMARSLHESVWGLRRAHGGRHGGTVRPDAARLPTRPAASGFRANVRAGGRGERRRRRRPARIGRFRQRQVADELQCASERCRPDRLITVRVLAAPYAPERVAAGDEHEDEDEYL
jgi:hypothetical protein